MCAVFRLVSVSRSFPGRPISDTIFSPRLAVLLFECLSGFCSSVGKSSTYLLCFEGLIAGKGIGVCCGGDLFVLGFCAVVVLLG